MNVKMMVIKYLSAIIRDFFSFLHGQVPCTSLFSFHFYGVRAIKPINSTTTGDLEVVIALASKESLCVYGQYEAQENINFLRISWFMNSS